MELINKTVYTIVIGMMILVLILYEIINGVVFGRFLDLEQKAINENVVRINHALNKELDNLSSIANDWGPWNDTYRFVGDLNQDYIKNNLIDGTFISLKINFIIFINNDGKIVYSKYFDLDKNQQSPKIEGLENYISKDSKLIKNNSYMNRKSGIVGSKENIALVAAAPITNSNFTGDIKGQVIVGKYFDDKLLYSLSKITSLNISYSLYEATNMNEDFKKAKSFLKGNNIFIEQIDKSYTAGYSTIKDIDNKPVVIFKVITPRDIYNEGSRARMYFMIITLVVFFAFTIIIIWILVYNPSFSGKTLRQRYMKNLLVKAIDNNEFVLHYQPQFDINTRICTGIEALLRWNNPQLGMVPPGKFIPFSEQNGLIMEIDKWVLKTVCKQCRIWEELNIRPKRVALNISSKQFENIRFLDYVKKTLEETKANANWLEFEITEGSLIQNPTQAIETLTGLRELGIKIALDDFGTGYSSLGYLSKFPIDKIKIDRAFVKNIPESKEDVV